MELLSARIVVTVTALSPWISYKQDGQMRSVSGLPRAMFFVWTRRIQDLNIEGAKLPNISKTSSPVYSLAMEIRLTVCPAS